MIGQDQASPQLDPQEFQEFVASVGPAQAQAPPVQDGNTLHCDT